MNILFYEILFKICEYITEIIELVEFSIYPSIKTKEIIKLYNKNRKVNKTNIATYKNVLKQNNALIKEQNNSFDTY